MSNKLEHIGFIMDGNMRWSKLKKLNYFDSYLAGAKNLLNLSEYIFKNYNISYISAFALSKNNLKRSPKLISTLKDVLEYFLNSEQKDKKKNYQVIFKGDKSFLKSYLIKKIDKLENLNINCSKKLFIYINYSGQDDILEACKKLIKSKKRVNYNNFIDNLVTKNVPFPDMLIRTGGYKRISDFMLFQSSFSELMFTDKLWPNFKKVDLDKFIQNYNKIDRKFGH